MRPPDRIERAKEVIQLRSIEAQQCAASMAIQAHIEAEQKDAERQQSAEQLRGYAATVLDRLDQKGFPEIEPFKVRKKVFLGRDHDVEKPGWRLGGVEKTTIVRGDESRLTVRYYLLIDGTFAMSPPSNLYPSPTNSSMFPVTPEEIIRDPDVHTTVLRKLLDLGGSPEIF